MSDIGATIIKVAQGWRVRIVNKNGFSDWPCRYDDRRIVYDCPHAFTQGQKREVERTFQALHEHKGYAFWVLESESGHGHFTPRYRLAKLCNAKWPAGAFEEYASKQGYTRLHKDDTLIGGYFEDVETGDCLVCLPRGSKPWEHV